MLTSLLPGRKLLFPADSASLGVALTQKPPSSSSNASRVFIPSPVRLPRQKEAVPRLPLGGGERRGLSAPASFCKEEAAAHSLLSLLLGGGAGRVTPGLSDSLVGIFPKFTDFTSPVLPPGKRFRASGSPPSEREALSLAPPTPSSRTAWRQVPCGCGQGVPPGRVGRNSGPCLPGSRREGWLDGCSARS